MPISPWYVGMTGKSFTIYCRDDSGQAMPLYNADGTTMNASQFTLLIKPDAGGSEIAGGGLFQVVDPDVGLVRYQPAGSDVMTAGLFDIAVEIETQNSGPIYSDRDTWNIEAR